MNNGIEAQHRGPTRRLEGRVALITGASRGIGAAVARSFAKEGAAVCLASAPDPARDAEAEAVASEIRAAGGTALTVSADLAQASAASKLVERTRAGLGAIDIIVNNAAYSPRTPWREIPLDEWDEVQAVNVRAGWLLVRESYSDLQRSENSAVINVTSVLVESGGNPGALHYTTSKSAVIGMTRAMARELGVDGVRVNAIMPGAIRTEDEMERAPIAAVLEPGILDHQSLKRRGMAEDVAGAFVFLASAESSFITGQIINVDGGWIHY